MRTMLIKYSITMCFDKAQNSPKRNNGVIGKLYLNKRPWHKQT